MAQFDSYAPRIRVTPVLVPSVAYTSGDVVGGIMAIPRPFNDMKNGVLKSLTVKDADNQKAAMTVLLFDQLPTGTYTDNGAFAWGTGDFAKCIGQVQVATADYVTVNGKAIADEDLARVIQDATASVVQGADTNLWAIAVTTGTPTYTTASSLELQFGVLQS